MTHFTTFHKLFAVFHGYSIFNLYTITFVELNETKLKIRFESKSFLKTEFFLNLENISNKDFLLLKENLC